MIILINKLFSEKSMSLITKILIGYDGSKAGDKALDYAIGIAKTFNAKLYILHVIEEGKIAIAPDSSMYLP